MYRKYKIRKRHKINIYAVFAVLAISLMFMSYGYSLWSDKLTISGKATAISSDETEMKVEIAQSLASVTISGFKLVSNTAEGSKLTTILDVTDSNAVSTGIFVFYFTNKSGDNATDGKVITTVTGNQDAIGTVSPTVSATVANNQQVSFHAYIPVTASKITVETTLDICMQYTINGEIQVFHNYVVFRPMV